MNPENEKGPPASEPRPITMPPDYSRRPRGSTVEGAALRFVTALASRLARLLGRPRWAVALVFALEDMRLKLESRRQL